MKKRFLASLLALCLIISLLPATALAAEGDAAQVGETTYATLQEAVTAAESMDGEITVTLLKNVEEGITVSQGNFTLDLNGQVISFPQTGGEDNFLGGSQ